MLQVKTYVGTSTISGAGNGLFAGEHISKGAIIWKLNTRIDKVIPIQNYVYINDMEREYLEKYAYREGDYLILCSDDGKYFNHSSVPNVDDMKNDVDGSITVANRDIKAGEELLCDYSTFDDDSKNKQNIFNNK